MALDIRLACEAKKIPLVARIVAIVDVYDALASRRPYKEAFPHEACVAAIKEAAGTHFDPDLVEVFLSIEKQFENISRRFREADKTDADIGRDVEDQNVDTSIIAESALVSAEQDDWHR